MPIVNSSTLFSICKPTVYVLSAGVESSYLTGLSPKALLPQGNFYDGARAFCLSLYKKSTHSDAGMSEVNEDLLPFSPPGMEVISSPIHLYNATGLEPQSVLIWAGLVYFLCFPWQCLWGGNKSISVWQLIEGPRAAPRAGHHAGGYSRCSLFNCSRPKAYPTHSNQQESFWMVMLRAW